MNNIALTLTQVVFTLQRSDSINADISVRLNQLKFSYHGLGGDDILHIPEWQLDSAERCFVFGASGAGKSTLLNLISGVLTPTSGELFVLGKELSAMSARQRDRFRARHIGVVFQQFNLIPYLSVEENIKLAMWFADSPTNEFNLRLAELFDSLQLKTELLKRESRHLSVGQQQRVAIARALINQPELLIVDEPTSALDSYARDKFMQLLMSICSSHNSALLFVSHDLSLQSYFDVHLNLGDLNQAGGHNA